MAPARNELRRRLRPWLLFASQQALLFASALVFLRTVQSLTGHRLHGMRDRIGPLEALALLLLYGTHVGLTIAVFRRASVGTSQPLGIGLSGPRAMSFVVGMLVAFAFCAWPWLAGIAVGSAHITHWISPAAASSDGWQIGFWLLLGLLVNSVAEETTNRAFPMRLWSDSGLWFRVLVPSLVFAALHLADEPFEARAFALRTLAGVTFSLGYAATGNIWLGAGAHSGMNYAGLWHAGLWHAGSLVSIDGRPVVPEDVGELGFALFAAAGYALYCGRARRAAGRAVSAEQVTVPGSVPGLRQ